MNKRILKLFNEAGFHQPEMERLGIEDKFEKFAELIVADCIRIVEGYCETSPEIYGLPLEILEHFDIELKDE